MKRFLKQNIVILVLLNSGNLFNYLFQLVVGRCMSPADFGGFNALNSTMVIFSAPLAIVPLVMARFTARFAGRATRTLVRHTYRATRWTLKRAWPRRRFPARRSSPRGIRSS